MLIKQYPGILLLFIVAVIIFEWDCQSCGFKVIWFTDLVNNVTCVVLCLVAYLLVNVNDLWKGNEQIIRPAQCLWVLSRFSVDERPMNESYKSVLLKLFGFLIELSSKLVALVGSRFTETIIKINKSFMRFRSIFSQPEDIFQWVKRVPTLWTRFNISTWFTVTGTANTGRVATMTKRLI